MRPWGCHCVATCEVDAEEPNISERVLGVLVGRRLDTCSFSPEETAHHLQGTGTDKQVLLWGRLCYTIRHLKKSWDWDLNPDPQIVSLLQSHPPSVQCMHAYRHPHKDTHRHTCKPTNIGIDIQTHVTTHTHTLKHAQECIYTHVVGRTWAFHSPLFLPLELYMCGNSYPSVNSSVESQNDFQVIASNKNPSKHIHT